MMNTAEARLGQTEAEMPKYRCHKVVHALKISSITSGPGEMTTLGAEHPSFAPFQVDAEYMSKHEPYVGGYYVVYEDGYRSYSPAKQFEEGYTEIS